MRKFAILLVVLLLVSSLMLVNPVYAVPKPSIPEFTVKVIDNSYDVPTSYSKDPYTGEAITSPGYRVNNQTIIVTIKNQHFTSGTSFLCYNVRAKGHFEGETGWQERYHFSPTSNGYPNQSLSNETVLSFIAEYPANAQVDIQIQALAVCPTQVFVHASEHIMDFSVTLVPGYVVAETSGWSNTQTVTFSEPLFGVETTTLAILTAAIVLVVIVGLLVYFKKRKRGHRGEAATESYGNQQGILGVKVKRWRHDREEA